MKTNVCLEEMMGHGNGLSCLSEQELLQVRGGSIPWLSPVTALAALTLGIMEFCYSIGKDCAIREDKAQ